MPTARTEDARCADPNGEKSVPAGASVHVSMIGFDDQSEQSRLLDREAVTSKLDSAVAAAYRWPANMNDEETLSRLLELKSAKAVPADGAGNGDEHHASGLAREIHLRSLQSPELSEITFVVAQKP